MSYLSALNYKYKQEDSEETLFVFDTNYFLYAYQSYSNGDSYIKALENKKKDIYIPFMTYIEFLSNINSVTSSLKSDIKILENYVNSVVEEVKIFDITAIKQKLKSESFKNKSKNYDQLNNLLKKDIEEIINKYVESSVIEVENKCIEIENILNEKLKGFSDSEKNLPKIAEYEKKIGDLTDRIDKLFESTSVLGEMYTQENINEYISDMDDRYAKNIPPGFCDESKGDKENIFGDLVIPDKAGDLILWKDLINLLQVNEEKKEKFSKVVIVTNDGLSDEKSDWRIKLGKERVVHDQLKIEFYNKTGKLLDLMKVEDFIEYFSLEDEVTKEHIANEIKTFKEVYFSKEEKIVFTLFGDVHVLNNQKEMMEKVFITVINMKNLRYNAIRDLPCISTKHEELNTTFDSYTELFLDEETEILLGTRLNRTDKLRYIYKLFKLAGIDSRDLIFESKELQKIWQKFFQGKEKLLHSEEIIVSLERPENLLGISVIGDVKFLKSGEEIENNLTSQIRDKLINCEFHDESRKPKEIEFKDIMWNLGYNIENHFIDFDDF
ncbi:PIN-like domain-containing protein [Bacillus atrophaeus]|uniref:PIN-like domain-containing protein n=1 Tax=Bacillus atrophaeus TaxID=1452 RepID=UPI00227F470D|nr:PIN-like domain-containing protein [Bacillus atrophaeus]MCY8974746.1 PIN-like domain-containing protein [Bacillus atrophaeus]